MTSDNLLATDVIATPNFCALKPTTLKSVMKIVPVSNAQRNQGSPIVLSDKGKLPFSNEPVITQVK